MYKLFVRDLHVLPNIIDAVYKPSGALMNIRSAPFKKSISCSTKSDVMTDKH